MASWVCMRLLGPINLDLMDEGRGGGRSSGEESPRPEESHEFAATIVACRTEGSGCRTPSSTLDGNGGVHPIDQPPEPTSQQADHAQCCMLYVIDP